MPNAFAHQSPTLARIPQIVGVVLGFFLVVLSAAFSYSCFTGEILLGRHFWPIGILFIMCYIENGFLISSFIYFLAFALVLILPTTWYKWCLFCSPDINFFQVTALDFILFNFVLDASHGIYFTNIRLRIRRSGTTHGTPQQRVSFAHLHYPAHIIGSLAIAAFLLVNFDLSSLLAWIIAVACLLVIAVQIAARLRGAAFFFRSEKQPTNTGFWQSFPITRPWEAQFATYVAARWIGILTAFLIYLYVIMLFASVYYFIDNCDNTLGLCKYVNYDAALYQPDNQNSEQCWSFSGIKPPDGFAKLCDNHLSSTSFSMKTFLPYFYFSVVTSTTVGYGDIHPISVSAVTVVILHHLVAVIMLIAIAGQVAGLTVQQKLNQDVKLPPLGSSHDEGIRPGSSQGGHAPAPQAKNGKAQGRAGRRGRRQDDN